MRTLATRKPMFGTILEGPYIRRARKRLPWGLIVAGLTVAGLAIHQAI